jgi:uncharacterized membrane protein YkvA (DUF1232 family)
MDASQPNPARRRVRGRNRGAFNIPYGYWILICLVYIVSPFDFIPDFLPLVGWTDDTGVLGFAIYNVVQWYRARRSAAVDAPRDQDVI